MDRYYTRIPYIPKSVYAKIGLIMRLTTLLLITFFVQVSASVHGQKVTLRQQNTTLESLFREIRNQTGYNFYFDGEVVSPTLKGSVNVKEATIEQALAEILAGKPLTYEIKDKLVIITNVPHAVIGIRADGSSLVAAFAEVRGRVVDSLGQPLAGASVRVLDAQGKRTVLQTQTNENGEFLLRNVPDDSFLEITFVGFISQVIKVTGNVGIVVLQVNPSELEEVAVEVNTGYFAVPKERATGSFTHVDQKLLSRSVGSNVIDRLRDVVPGLTFNQTNMGRSTLRNQPEISIRGRSTINANAAPLIILDNFPYEGDINDLNPEDIESVTILQDAAAASIWGARAGNGVIVLTSKSGALDRPLQVSVRSDFSISAKPNLYYTPTMPMADFVEIERFLFDRGAWNAYINQGFSYITPAVELLKLHRDEKLSDAELESALDGLKGQDVRRDLQQYFFRPASLRKVATSFDGGGRYNTYYFSAGYDENIGTQQEDDSKRISLNARNSYRLWQDKLKFDVGLLFSKTNSNSQRMPNGTYNVPYDRLADDSGNPLSIGGANRFRQSYIDTAGNGLLMDWNYRPLEELGMNALRNDDLAYQLSTGVELKPVSWLGLSAQYRYSSGNGTLHGEWDAASFQMRNLYNQFTRINHAAGTATSVVPKGGQLNTSYSNMNQHNARFQANVYKEWERHQVSLVAGSEINDQQTLFEVAAARLGYHPDTETFTPVDLAGRYLQYHIATLTTITAVPGQPTRETAVNRNLMHFGNVSYTYDRRYTATFSVRKDEANIFGVEANLRGRPFWSAGLLWHIHDESFVQLPWLQKLSLRGTHGMMGNVSTASAYLTSMVGSAAYVFSGRTFQSITTPPNPLLSWENVRMTNLAVDFSVLEGRISGAVERYFRKSTDLLSQNPIYPSSGVSTLYGNWSSMKSSGWDITINSQQLRGALSWSTNLILSHIKDVVTEYVQKPTNDRLYLTSNLGQYPIEGKPLYGIYSMRYAGLDKVSDPIGYLDGVESKDYSNIYNGTALSDYRYHGRATPPTFGSIRNTFGYRGVELSMNVSYHLNYYFRQQAFSSAALYNVLGYGTAIYQSHYNNRWQQPGDESTTRIPAAAYPLNTNRDAFYGMAEDHVQRGDHIRLRDIRLAYSFPGLKMKSIKGVQAYAYIDNVAVIWAANPAGYDPNTIPDIGFVYPTPRTFAFGINLKI